MMAGQYYGASADKDSILPAFATPQRRRLLDVLSTVDGPIYRQSVAEALVDNEMHESTASLDEQVRRTEVELHHHLLPKLEEAGALTYHAAEGRIVDVTLEAPES